VPKFGFMRGREGGSRFFTRCYREELSFQVSLFSTKETGSATA